MTETVRKHKAYRLCTDAANALWDKISFWTHGSDVEFDDGTTAEDVKALAEDAVNWTNDVTSQIVNSYSSVPNSAALYNAYEELSEKAGIIAKTQSQYDALPVAEKTDPSKYYCITDQTLSGAPLDDDSISNGKVWSAQKIGNELAARDSDISDIQNDITTLNSKLPKYEDVDFTGTVSGAISAITLNLTIPTGFEPSSYYISALTQSWGCLFGHLRKSNNTWSVIIYPSNSASQTVSGTMRVFYTKV